MIQKCTVCGKEVESEPALSPLPRNNTSTFLCMDCGINEIHKKVYPSWSKEAVKEFLTAQSEINKHSYSFFENSISQIISFLFFILGALISIFLTLTLDKFPLLRTSNLFYIDTLLFIIVLIILIRGFDKERNRFNRYLIASKKLNKFLVKK